MLFQLLNKQQKTLKETNAQTYVFHSKVNNIIKQKQQICKATVYVILFCNLCCAMSNMVINTKIKSFFD